VVAVRPPRPAALLTALLVPAVLLLAGCGSSSSTPPAPGSAPTSTAAIAQPPVVVAVTDPGAEPREVLGRSTPTGTTQLVQLGTTSHVLQTVGTDPQQDLSTPDLTLPLTATVPAAGAVALTLGTPTASDPVLSGALSPAEGSTAGLTVRTSGAVDELRITPATGLDDSARAAVEQGLRQAVQLAPVLPPDPVGVGAVWTTTQVIDSLGLQIDQVTTTTLTAVSGSTLTLAQAITQTPETATWTLPGGGGTLNVDAYPVTGSGTLTVDTAQPLPTAGTLSLGGDQVYSDPSSALQLRQSVRSTVTWTS
jgi:hypothetical protein